MSVQQVKDRFQELTMYLGRDVTGLDKLRKLKEAVNVLRTRLASAQEQLAGCATTRQLAVERAISAETELANARIEIHSLQQRVENLTREMEQATKPLPTDDDKESDTKLDRNELASVIKRLRKRMRYCPAQAKSHQRVSHLVPVYNRDDFAKGWSHEALWTLGASVAMLCINGNQVIIQGEVGMVDHDEEHEGFQRNHVQWYAQHNVDLTSTTTDTRAGFVRLRNVQEGHLKIINAEKNDQQLQNAHSKAGIPMG